MEASGSKGTHCPPFLDINSLKSKDILNLLPPPKKPAAGWMPPEFAGTRGRKMPARSFPQ